MHPFVTALEDEGFGDVRSERLVEGFARHLMVAMDRWQEGGFASVVQEYKAKLEPLNGARRDIEENGDLCIERAGKPVERQSLRSTLKAPSWLDAKTGGPRL